MQFSPFLAAVFMACLASLGTFLPSACRGEAPMPAVVDIVSTSGRNFRGRISPETDSTALHLEVTQGTIRVIRPIAWEAIDQVQLNSQPASLEELATLALTLKAATADASSPDTLYLGPSGETFPSGPQGARVGYEEVAPTSAVAEAAVAYLSASAHYANWDADAAVDGLEITFRAMDASGQAVSVQGHLEAELYAFRQQAFHHVPRGLGARWERLSTWRIPLDQTHGWYDSRIARLPYQGASPAEDESIVPQGLLVLKLVIPGQGVFSATLDDIRLRPYSAIRDANQLRGNPRHVPGENPRYRPYRTP